MEADAEPEEQRKREPFFKLPVVIVLLLASLIVIHAAVMLAGPEAQNRIIEAFAFIPARESGALPYAGGPASRIWPFVTHLFLHGNLAHIGFNSLWLMAVGTPVARRLGTAPFLGFYLLCGALSAATHLAFNLSSTVPVIGASGAIAGCMAGAVRVMFSPDRFYFGRSILVGSLAPLMDRRIIFITVIWIVINAIMGSGLLPMPGQGNNAIAWEAHIGGWFAGLLLIPVFDHWASRNRDLPAL